MEKLFGNTKNEDKVENSSKHENVESVNFLIIQKIVIYVIFI